MSHIPNIILNDFKSVNLSEWNITASSKSLLRLMNSEELCGLIHLHEQNTSQRHNKTNPSWEAESRLI